MLLWNMCLPRMRPPYLRFRFLGMADAVTTRTPADRVPLRDARSPERTPPMQHEHRPELVDERWAWVTDISNRNPDRTYSYGPTGTVHLEG